MADQTPTASWVPHGPPDHDLAAVLAAVERHGPRLKREFPPLPIPRTGVGGIAIGEYTTTTLLVLWQEAADIMTGWCPVCGGRIRVTSASAVGGMGAMTGSCLSCGIPMRREAEEEEVLRLIPPGARRVEQAPREPTTPLPWNGPDPEAERIIKALLIGTDPASWDPCGLDDWQPLLKALAVLGEGGLVPPCGAGLEW